ncbi:MAG: PDDEXK nuclease domain-containing protein [Bacteroidales bacterium]|jgi:predicted nuclease of restriction endonuclease-like (RecB) superfamily|nr:PDDEXK nuclease domain-containing protein [Bacteroidales bacterium]
MENSKSLTTQYNQAAEIIKTAILQSQYDAAKGVNRVQLALYYGIGKFISIKTRKGVWGTNALQTISDKLRKDLPGLRGFSANSLKNMRKFYENWIMLDAANSDTNLNSTIAIVELEEDENVVEVGAMHIQKVNNFPVEDFFRVPFTHHIRIIEGTKDIKARYYYIHKTAEEHLQVDKLTSLIKAEDYMHCDKMPSNFSKTISDASLARKAVLMFKDEYLLDFINVEQIGERECIDVDERLVEKQIIDNIKRFIMSFGSDFAFIGNQYHLEIHGVEHFPDLLFFNRELNAMVVVELKTGEFKTSYLGQLMGYLSILDAKVKKPHENPSIGIVLCKSANKDYVEFVIQDYNKPMGVATYTTSEEMPEKLRNALPDIEELKKLL